MSNSLPTPIGKQKEVLYLPAWGHTTVLGTAGSGKTTLAILRALYLADPATDHFGPTLLVTFNRCLVTYMKHLAPLLPKGLEVTNYHRFARGYLNSKGLMGRNSICKPHQRRQFLSAALGAANADGLKGPIAERALKFLDDEIRWIQQHDIADEAAYVAAERVGRAGSRLSRADRPALFTIYEHYLAQRRLGGQIYDWDDLAGAVLRELSSDTQARRFRHVVIDEGQDFSPVMLQSLAAAVPANEGSLTFFGDMAQQIYGHRMSWRSAGLQPPRVWHFEQNYRNTRQIALLALALAEMPEFMDVPDLVEPVAPTADGPLPVLRDCVSEEEELQLVARQAGALVRTGTVAVLFRTRSQERKAKTVPAAWWHATER